MFTTADCVKTVCNTLYDMRADKSKPLKLSLIQEVVNNIGGKAWDCTYVDVKEVSYCFGDGSLATLYHAGDNAEQLKQESEWISASRKA